jgi:hypothetical protein
MPGLQLARGGWRPGLPVGVITRRPPPQVVSLSVSPAAQTLNYLGAHLQYAATATFDDYTTADVTNRVAWTSDTHAVATISGSGYATAEGVGSTTIFATLGGISASTSLTVKALASLSLDPVSLDVDVSDPPVDMVCTGHYSDATTVDLTADAWWTSSDVGVATVSNSPGTEGRVTFVDGGTCSITAYYAGLTEEAVVDVFAPPTLLNDADSTIVSHVYVDGGALVDTQANSWAVNGSPTFNAEGTLTGLGGGALTAETVSGLSDANYFSLGTGSDVLDFGDQPFIVTFIVKGGSAFALSVITDADDAAEDGWKVTYLAGNWALKSDNLTGDSGSGIDGSNYKVITFARRADDTTRCKVNGGAISQVIAAGALTAATAIVARIGRANNAGASFPGNIAEIRIASGASDLYDDTYINALHAELGY